MSSVSQTKWQTIFKVWVILKGMWLQYSWKIGLSLCFFGLVLPKLVSSALWWITISGKTHLCIVYQFQKPRVWFILVNWQVWIFEMENNLEEDRIAWILALADAVSDILPHISDVRLYEFGEGIFSGLQSENLLKNLKSSSHSAPTVKHMISNKGMFMFSLRFTRIWIGKIGLLLFYSRWCWFYFRYFVLYLHIWNHRLSKSISDKTCQVGFFQSNSLVNVHGF